MTKDIFDYARFDYVSIGAPNVLVQVDKGATPPAGFAKTVTAELLLLLAKRHPAWKFRVVISGYGQHTDNLAPASAVYVLQGHEVLGSFNVAHYPRRGIEIRSRSIERAMDRKSYKFTADLVVARKLVEKNFTPLPTSERVGDELDKLLDAARGHAVYSDLQKSKGLSTVVVDNGFVFVCPQGQSSDQAVMYAPGDIPADIAQAVAVLGMAPDSTPVPGLGAKVGVDAYIISRATIA
jgi:hypothetical protein